MVGGRLTVKLAGNLVEKDDSLFNDSLLSALGEKNAAATGSVTRCEN